MSIITLENPIQFEGKEVKEINLDFDSFNSGDMFKAVRQWNKLGNHATVPTMDMDFIMYFASYIADVPQELFDKLPIPEGQAIYMQTFAFLNKSVGAKPKS